MNIRTINASEPTEGIVSRLFNVAAKGMFHGDTESCRRLDVDRYLRKHSNSWYNENCLTWNEACVAMKVKMCNAESKCRQYADKFKEE